MSTHPQRSAHSRAEHRQSVRLAVGRAIRAAYTGRFTQTELARHLGVAQNTVSRWTTGEVEPSLADIVVIEDACQLQRGAILRAAGLVADEPVIETASATS